jgi:hypothetical protein
VVLSTKGALQWLFTLIGTVALGKTVITKAILAVFSFVTGHSAALAEADVICGREFDVTDMAVVVDFGTLPTAEYAYDKALFLVVSENLVQFSGSLGLFGFQL